MAKDRFGDYTVTQAPEDGLVLPFDEVKQYVPIIFVTNKTPYFSILFLWPYFSVLLSFPVWIIVENVLNFILGKHTDSLFCNEAWRCIYMFYSINIVPSSFKDVTLRKKMTVHSYIEFIGTLSDYNCSIGTIWTRDEAEEKRRLFERE